VRSKKTKGVKFHTSTSYRTPSAVRNGISCACRRDQRNKKVWTFTPWNLSARSKETPCIFWTPPPKPFKSLWKIWGPLPQA